MAAQAPDWFELAALRSADLPAQLSIRQRLDQLKHSLEQRHVALDDPSVPAMIAALFPPGTLQRPAGAAAGLAVAEPITDWPAPPVPPIDRISQANGMWLQIRRIGLFGWLRLLAPLLFLLLASDAIPVEQPPPPRCPGQLDCPGPPEPPGRWVFPPRVEVEIPNPDYYTVIVRNATLALAGWLVAVWWLFRRDAMRTRDANPDVDPVIAFALRNGRKNLFAGPAFDGALRQFRQRLTVSSHRLDVARSLKATVARAGFPALIYGLRRLRPEYLILSERESHADHLPELGRALHHRLGAAQLRASLYEFFGAPFRLRAEGREEFEPVEAVLARNSGARALLIAECTDLADALPRGPAWTAALAHDHRPVLLNPRDQAHWDEPETQLQGGGLTLLEASAINPRRLARTYAEDEINWASAVFESAENGDLPAFLEPERALLLSETPPHKDEIAAVLKNLTDHWLDAQEVRWLRTLALFPVVHPSLTYFAGMAIYRSDTVPIKSYLKLARLPWFRAGRIPGWLRRALLSRSSSQVLEQARRIVQAFFTPEAVNAIDARDIVRLCESSVGKRRQKFVNGLRRSEIPALRDPLLTSAFVHDDPAQIGFDPLKRRPAPGWLWLLSALMLLVMGLAAYALLDELPQRTIERQPPPEWIPDAKPPVVNDDPLPPPPPSPPEISRQVYAQIARENDRDAVAVILAALSGSRTFEENDLRIQGIEYRRNSPETSQVRCFNRTTCEIARDVVDELGSYNVTARVVDFSAGSMAGANRPLEIWFAAGAVPTPPEPPRKICQPGPYIVFFDWDQSAITPEAAGVLDLVVTNYLEGCQGARVLLSGHTDRSESERYAVGLSERMVESVRSYLELRGISSRSISAEAFGESRPLVETADGVREAQNRRVEIVFGPGSGN